MRAARSVVALAAVAALAGSLLVGSAAPASAAAPGRPLVICPDFSGLNTANTWQSVFAGRVSILGRTARVVTSTGAVSWSADPFRNASWQSWLHSLKWIGDLVYTASGRHPGVTPAQRQAALDRAVAIVRNYQLRNPGALTASPTQAQRGSAGHRAQAIGCLVESLGPQTPTWLRAYAQKHSSWLAVSKNYLGAWNQGLDQDLGIITISCLVGPSTMRTFGVARASRTMAANIDAEGATTEQAIGYASYGYRLWVRTIETMTACGVAPPATAQRVSLVPEFLAWATTPAGTLEQLGDTMAVATPVITGTAAEYAATRGTTGTAPTARVKIYRAQGYVFGRSTWDNLATSSYYTVRFGPKLAHHGHMDRTSVTFWSHGRPILVDSGHIGYTNKTARKYLISTQAHNNVSTPPRNGLRPASGSASLVTGFTSDAADGYTLADRSLGLLVNGRYVPYPKTRSIIVLRDPDVMIVSDSVGGGAAGQAWTQRWHMAPGMKVASSSSVRTTFTNGTTVYAVPGLTTVGSKQTRSTSWVSRSLGTKTPSVEVVQTAVGRSARFLTIVAAEAGTTYSVSGAVVSIWHQGRLVARVTRTSTGTLALVP